MTGALIPPLKWYGGKHLLAPKIVALMPPHLQYIEPYFGGGAVLLAKDPVGVSEVVNDLSGDLTNFWRVLATPALFRSFKRVVEAVPLSEAEFLAAQMRLANPRGDELASDSVVRAVDFFIVCRQSFAARMQHFAPAPKNRTARGMNQQVSAWLTAIRGLAEAHARLQRVMILNRDALEVIRQHDSPTALFYCDPPYLHETRTSDDDFEHEMSREQHEALLDVLANIQGNFLLSGYRSGLYDRQADRCGWKRVDFAVPNRGSRVKHPRRMIDCVWMNFHPESRHDTALTVPDRN